MRNAIAAYAILIPMVLAAILVSAHSGADVSGSAQCSASSFHVLGGTILLEAGKYQPALKEFQEAVKLDPGSVVAYIQLADAYQGLNKHKEAIEACDKGISIEPSACIYTTRGFSYGQLGDLTAQMRDYDLGIKTEPSVGSTYAYRARAFEKQGNLEAAKQDREKAKSLGYRPGTFDQSQLKQ